MRDHYGDAAHQVLEVIVRLPGTMLDDIVLECPNLIDQSLFDDHATMLLQNDRLPKCAVTGISSNCRSLSNG